MVRRKDKSGKPGKIRLPKIDLDKKRNNLALTAVLLAAALVVIVVSGVQFEGFRNYRTEFYTGGVDEFQKFSDYSPLLKGTVADSDIFIKYGDENTVAVVRADRADEFDTAGKIDAAASRCALTKDLSGVNGGVGTDELVNIGSADEMTFLPGAADAFEGVKNGTYDAAIVSYADFRNARAGYPELVVSRADVETVPSILVMGGTHPNEPAGQLTSVLFLEDAVIRRGKMYVITEVNRSAYSHSQPQEATAWYYHLKTQSGKTRTFKFGSRATNFVDQWPTPDVYTHSSGQQLSSTEVRNINRAYPGARNGTFTEKIAYAVTQLVRRNDITMVIDLHEASPEYVTINAIVAHDDAVNLATSAKMWELDDYFEIGLETSPHELRGLTHRDLGDFTYAYVCLAETSNASQGKLRGKFSEGLITYEEPDKFYDYAYARDNADDDVSNNLLYAPVCGISERVARHTATIGALIDAFNGDGAECRARTVTVGKIGQNPSAGKYLGELVIEGMPGYYDICNDGLSAYLHDVER